MIEIVEHRAEWSDEHAALAARLRGALGPLALAVDPIGSTAVPGLAAKDVLDVQVTVEALDAALLRPLLEAAGLRWSPAIDRDHRPPGCAADGWDKLYFRESPGAREVHVHVRVAGAANQRYALLFRDYLRAHPHAAAAYSRLKRGLAAQCGDDRDAYSDVKDPVCDLVMQAAEVWAVASDWPPGRG